MGLADRTRRDGGAAAFLGFIRLELFVLGGCETGGDVLVETGRTAEFFRLLRVVGLKGFCDSHSYTSC